MYSNVGAACSYFFYSCLYQFYTNRCCESIDDNIFVRLFDGEDRFDDDSLITPPMLLPLSKFQAFVSKLSDYTQACFHRVYIVLFCKPIYFNSVEMLSQQKYVAKKLKNNIIIITKNAEDSKHKNSISSNNHKITHQQYSKVNENYSIT